MSAIKGQYSKNTSRRPLSVLWLQLFLSIIHLVTLNQKSACFYCCIIMSGPNNSEAPYNDLCFTLSIKLDIPPTQMSPMLLNLQAATDAKLVDIEVKKIYRIDDRLLIPINYTEEEINSVIVFNEDTIELEGHNNFRKRYNFPTNRVTMKMFVNMIIDFEKEDRLKYEWFGGIDCHCIFYEGLHPTNDGAYSIFWGS